MGWSLDSQPLKQPELLDAFFLAVGKALCLACEFEAKCKYILHIIKLDEYCKEGNHLSDLAVVLSSTHLEIVLPNSFKPKLLGPTIKDVGSFPDFATDGIAVLERAKDARNFVAHESALLGGCILNTSARTIRERIARLRAEIKKLIAGDNLASRWIYEFEEKVLAHPIQFRAYPQRVEQWIFAEIDSGSITEAPEDTRTLEEKLDALCSIPVLPKRTPQ